MEIIKTSRHLSCAASFALSVALANSSASAADVVLHRVPALSAETAQVYPVNVARYRLGAQIKAESKSTKASQLELSANSQDKNTAEAALLCDDPTVGYPLHVGKTTLVVALPQVENVATISLINSGAKGRVKIAAANTKLAADSAQWQTFVDGELTADGLHANVGPAEAKYVRLSFDISEAGRVADLGVYATPRISDFTSPRNVNFTSVDKSDSFVLVSQKLDQLHAKARALYVSSGSDLAEANNMIDDQAHTAYTFSNEDSSPAAVIDLGQDANVRRVSVLYSAQPGTMQFFVAPVLPMTTASENVAIDDAFLAKLKLVGSVNDDGKQGRAAIDFPARAGRYLLVRWIPANGQSSAFSIAEIAAFGSQTSDKTLVAANTGLTFGQVNADGKTMLDGKTAMDGKTAIEPKNGPENEAPQSPAEGPPPTLPENPPFTFIPVMLPASP